MASSGNILHGPENDDFEIETELVPKIFYNLEKATNDIFAINVDSREVITYKQLWDKTIRIASALQSLGLGCGKSVAIVGENCLEVYSFYFAVVFTGASAACLNHTFKSGELSQLLNELRPHFVFCNKEFSEKTELALKNVKNRPPLIVPDGTSPHINYNSLLTHDPNDFTFPHLSSWDENIFGILLSSGTTGLPKGVQTRGKSIQNFILRFIPTHVKRIMTPFPICAGSSILFLSAAVKVLGTFIYGGKTHAAVANAMGEFKPNFYFNAAANLLKLALDPEITHENFSCLEHVLSSGSCLTREQIIFLNKELFNNRIGVANAYNSIEALGLTGWPKDTDLMKSPKIGSVGKLHPFVHLKVVHTESGEILGPGVEGELFVKTPFVMAGYKNNPEATAKVLDADGWYRTGDIGHYEEDGYIYITGRIKEIFKCMNRQVSPMQLEAIIQEHFAVSEAGVIGKPHPIDGFHPTAFVVLKQNVTPIDEKELLKFVNDQVDNYRKLHGGLYFVDYIPKTPSGKKMRGNLLKIFCP